MLNPASEHFLVTSLELGVVSGSLPSRILRLMVRYGIKPYRTVDDFFCKNTADCRYGTVRSPTVHQYSHFSTFLRLLHSL
jgi:hypothetical protein